MAIFPTFFFRQYTPGKYLNDILERKKAFLGYKKTTSQSRKIDIFPKALTHGSGPQMAIFRTFFFLGNIGQKNVFYIILEKKNAFVSHKKNKSEKLKN